MSPSRICTSRTLARCTLVTALAISAGLPSLATADPISVRHTQGAVHGFLVVRSQAGAVLGMTPNAARVRLSRVRKRLQGILTDLPAPDPHPEVPHAHD